MTYHLQPTCLESDFWPLGKGLAHIPHRSSNYSYTLSSTIKLSVVLPPILHTLQDENRLPRPAYTCHKSDNSDLAL